MLLHRSICTLGPSSPRTIAQQVEVLRKGYVRRCGVKAASLRFNSVYVTVSTICRISLINAQAWIETE